MTVMVIANEFLNVMELTLSPIVLIQVCQSNKVHMYIDVSYANEQWW